MQERRIISTFKKIVHESSEMVFLVDDSYPFTIFYSNASFESQIGKNLKEKSLIGLGLDINASLFKEELTFTFNGQEFWFKMDLPQDSDRGYLLFYKGKKTRIQDHLSAQEVNQLKRIKFYEQLLVESPGPFVVLQASGEVEFCNNQALELFRFEKSSQLKNLDQIRPFVEDKVQWDTWLGKPGIKKETETFTTVFYFSHADKLTVEATLKPMKINGEDFNVLSFTNISQRITLEKSIEKNSHFLKNLTEQVPGGLFQLVLDNDGQMSFSFLSKGIATVLGIDPKELDDIRDISFAISRVHPADLPSVVMSSIASARRQIPWRCQFRMKPNPASEEYRWVLGAARPQLLSEGDMVWYGYLTDISEQKEFEAKLNESKMAAEKANQIKSEFISMISHELRTPLNAIVGSTYSLLQDNPLSHQDISLKTINFAVDNMIIMINDLLDLQKIEAGKLIIDREPFNLLILCKQIVSSLSFHANDSKNKLILKFSEGLDIWVFGDKTRISQILNNLITNALKFTNQGNVDVTVRLEQVFHGRASVFFEVMDNGIGIAPAFQERVFQDFDQVVPSFSKKYGGTGLGLSITKKLLKLMGTEIKLDSELGVGSRFYFTLDFDLASPKIQKLDPTPENPGKRLHLLLAEDNEVNVLVLGRIIRKWGYTYQRVSNGREALDAARKSSFDCILMDIQMPEMDGYEATILIKEFSKVPVIALTASSKMELTDRIKFNGFDGFVTKPIDAGELLKTIQTVVSRSNQSA